MCVSLFHPACADSATVTIVGICVAVIGVIVLAGFFLVYQRLKRKHAAQFSLAQARKSEAYHNPMYDSRAQPHGRDAAGYAAAPAPAPAAGDDGGMYSDVPSAVADGIGGAGDGYYDVSAAQDDGGGGYMDVGAGDDFDEPATVETF